MKAKITIKNILFMVLSIVALCSVMGFGASAGYEFDCNHSLDPNGWTPDASLTCCEVQWCDECEDWAARTSSNSLLHNPGKWTEIVPHTCQQAGLEVIYCTECGVYEFERRTVPAHDYSVIYEKNATCLEDGYQLVVCLSCYDMKTATLTCDPDAHLYTDWQITTEATCATGSGVKTRRCLNYDANGNSCGKIDTMTYEDKNNHIKTDWDVNSEKIAPTCQADGSIVKICEGCNEEIKKILPAHSETDWTVLSSVPADCHSTGTERRRCKCGYEYDAEISVDMNNHVYGQWLIKKEPSCTAGIRFRECQYHLDVTQEQNIPATGEHHYDECEVLVAPSCSSIGREKLTCTDCGNTVINELPIKHNFTIWTEEVEMCCDESKLTDGSKLAKCKDCTYQQYFSIPALHDFGGWVITKRSTCEEGNEGVRERTCKGCGKVETETYVEQHDFSDWFVTSKPVCATDKVRGYNGQRTRWCNTCKYYEHETIAPEHEFEWEIIEYPTCFESGESVGECIYCGLVKTEHPVSEGHEYGEVEIGTGFGSEWQPLNDAEVACGTTVTERSCCIYCGDVKYENKTTEHVFGNWTADNGFTCGNGETRMTRSCKNCTVTETDQINRNHPNLKTVVTEATCSSSGYTKKVCPDCGYNEIVGEITPAKGHKLSESWTVKTPASCIESGARYKACANCEYLDYEVIEKTEHMLVYVELGVEPTCTKNGKTPTTYCAVCKSFFASVEIPATGHQYAEGSEVCSVCYAYAGSGEKNCVCACHSQSGIENIVFSLLNKLYQLLGINQDCRCGNLHYTEVGFIGKLLGRG